MPENFLPMEYQFIVVRHLCLIERYHILVFIILANQIFNVTLFNGLRLIVPNVG